MNDKTTENAKQSKKISKTKIAKNSKLDLKQNKTNTKSKNAQKKQKLGNANNTEGAKEKNDTYSSSGFKTYKDFSGQSFVNQVFSGISSKYDLMNDLMSFGLHRFWKKTFCDKVENLDSKIIDVACGSGDIGFKLINRAKACAKKPELTMCDINKDMLELAKDYSIDNNLINYVNFVEADAANMPFKDESFDYYLISFGIRNVQDKQKALKEAYRIIKKRGKFLCMEFSPMEPNLLSNIYDFYADNIIPNLGLAVTGNKGAYEYLTESIKAFPDKESFVKMISDAGFKNVSFESLNFGLVAIHVGYKI
jgi:demethylmenaquinone methyltransferase/2-methoxy-6-polyprenyl-1,4-benzoquinol methylase